MIRNIGFTRGWKFFFVLFVSLVCWDIYEHFTSPVYKYYRELSALLVNRQNDFESRVRDEFVPAIVSTATNFRASVSSSVSVTNSSCESFHDRHLTLPRSTYFVSSGRGGFRFGGYDFFVGDDIFGECILSIRPTCCITASGRILLFQPDSRSSDIALDINPKGVINDAGFHR